MASDPEFAAWLQGARRAVAAARTAARSGAAKHRDTRLDGVLPMQFEHNGVRHEAADAHKATVWSALLELSLYLWGFLAVAFLLMNAWIPAWLWIGLGAAAAASWALLQVWRRKERPAQQWREQAEVVPGILVYANEVLYAPGDEPASNAGFLFTFDANLAADPERFTAIARRCFDLHRPDTAARAGEHELQRRCRSWSEDRTIDDPHVFDRVRVPKSLCGNDATWMTMVCVDRASLPGGIIDRYCYALMARADHDESADLVPASVWSEPPPRPGAGRD